MGEELSFDNILGEQDIENLFSDAPETEAEEKDEEVVEDNKEEKKEEKVTEAINPDTLFEEEKPESVGNDNNKEEGKKEDAIPEKDDDTSPQNFYSSIASALAVDGVFPNLDEETIKKANTPELFSDLIEAEVTARLDEKQKRISNALENGVEPSEIRKYENTLKYISSLTEQMISEESEKGEQLRRQLIYQDFLNKGYTPEKANKFTERTVNAGTDIEDAKEALQGNKEYFQSEYDRLLQDAQKEADKEKAERKKQTEALQNSIMNDKQLFGDMEISNDLRRKVLDNISKPVYRDPETGEYMTAIQKYELEHKGDFLKYAGLLFTLTDGFKDFESFTKGKVKKEMKKGLRELEKTLNNSRRSPDGSLKMVTGVNEDPESFIGKGFKLDI